MKSCLRSSVSPPECISSSLHGDLMIADEHKERVSFTILDWLGLVVAVMATLALLIFPVTFAPAFLSILADFGGNLPAITVLALRPWFPPLLAVLPGLLLIFAWRGRGRSRRGLVVSAFVSSTVFFAFLLVAIYQPIFDLAGAIQP